MTKFHGDYFENEFVDIITELITKINELSEEFSLLKIPKDFEYYSYLSAVSLDIDETIDLINKLDNSIKDLDEAFSHAERINKKLAYFFSDIGIKNMNSASGYKNNNLNIQDDFFEDFIKNKVTAKNNTEAFYQISKVVKGSIQTNAQNGTMTYSDSQGIKVPYDIYNEKKFGSYADCSSYVTMCLYEYGVYTNNENMINFVENYRKEAGGNDIRKRWTNNSSTIL